jgi:hypothetical protein
MGQKIFVRAFDLDERLVGVAFLDVGVYVTSLRTLKNLLLIGDAVKSIWFVAFQEDPFKLVILAKDIRRASVANANFFFSEGTMSIVTGDDEGIIRIYEYSPEGERSPRAVTTFAANTTQILNPKMASICCAALNFMVKARVIRRSSSLVVPKKTMRCHKLSCFLIPPMALCRH